MLCRLRLGPAYSNLGLPSDRRPAAAQMADRPTKFDPSEAGEIERGFGLEALSFALRQWKFIGAVSAIVVLIRTTLLLQQIPLYTATSLVLLEKQRQKAPGGEAVVREAELDDAML